MNRGEEVIRGSGPLNVLIIGNNPLELSRIQHTLTNYTDRRLVSAFAFDLRSIVERLLDFRPDHILIDDNIGRRELKDIVAKLSRYRRTRDIPITVLKNSNYSEPLTTKRVMDYILKQNFSADGLYRSLLNSDRLLRAQRYLYSAYKKRKGQLLSVIRRPEPAL